jgi:hypothetical protein
MSFDSFGATPGDAGRFLFVDVPGRESHIVDNPAGKFR